MLSLLRTPMPMSAPHPPHPTPLAQAVGTRSNVQCLEKWYSQLSPSMVSRGDWGPGDDRRLLRSLYLRCGCGCGGGGWWLAGLLVAWRSVWAELQPSCAGVGLHFLLFRFGPCSMRAALFRALLQWRRPGLRARLGAAGAGAQRRAGVCVGREISAPMSAGWVNRRRDP